MAEYDTDGVSRRRYLAIAGTATVTSVAGCSGGGDESSTEPSGGGGGDSGDGGASASTTEAPTETATEEPAPAEFSEVSLSVPTSASIRSEVSVTVEATNTGGKSGTYSDTVAVVEGNSEFSREVTVEDVPPGETGTTTVGTSFDFADEYVFALSDGEAEATVVAEALRRAAGESLDVNDDLRMTLSGVSFHDTIRLHSEAFDYGFSSNSYDGAFGVPTGKVLALYRFTLENTGTSSSTLSMNSFVAADGGLYTGFGRPSLSAARVGGASLFESGYDEFTATLEPSQRRQGWVLAQHSREAARNGVELHYQGDAAGTPPEAAFVHEPESDKFAFPEFEIADIESPDGEVPVDTDYEFSFTVTNVGDGPGTFQGAIQWTEENEPWYTDSLAEGRSYEADLAPGESKRFSDVSQSAVASTYTYRIAPLTERFEITFSD